MCYSIAIAKVSRIILFIKGRHIVGKVFFENKSLAIGNVDKLNSSKYPNELVTRVNHLPARFVDIPDFDKRFAKANEQVLDEEFIQTKI